MYKLIAPAPFGADQETGKSRHMLRSQFEPDECNITSAGSMVNPNIAEGPLNHGPPSIAIPSVRRLLSNQLPHVFCEPLRIGFNLQFPCSAHLSAD